MEESNNPVDIRALGEKIAQESAFVKLLTSEINNVIVGQSQMIERLMIGLLGGGHILLEGVPGLAKTLAINSLAKAVDGDFSRIQFTPDLLPADVIGTMIYNVKDGDFSIKKGPVFANFVLADEINRAPAKVQSALLEAMQERQVTIGEETFRLDDPFLVMATQNPIEQEGTYPLPEAQMDRFMLKTVVSYPTKEDEQRIMRRNTRPEGSKAIRPVVSLDDIRRGREAAKEVYMDEKIDKSKIGRLADFSLLDYESVYPAVPTINLTGDDYRTVMWNAIMGYVDVDDAIEDLNTRYNEAYDADIESGSVKRLVIEDYDPLHPSDGTATYLDK